MRQYLENVIRQTGGEEPLPLLDAGQLLVGGQDQILNITPKLFPQLTPWSLWLRRLLLWLRFVMLFKLDNLLVNILFLV